MGLDDRKRVLNSPTGQTIMKQPTIPDPRLGISATASAYLQAALTILQTNSLHRATIDWPALFAATWPLAQGAQQPADTYPAIEFALRQLNDGHSFFQRPETAQAIESGALDSRNRLPSGRLLMPGIAYLHVPDFTGSSAAATVYARTLQQIIGQIDATGPVGWIVDLTDNTGGSMFPMLVGLGPLFDVEDVGAFVYPDGQRLGWRYVAGQCIVGPGICLALVPPVVQLQHKPASIAVLTGPSTISSGEVVAVAFRKQARARSFGQPTAGCSTCNQGFALSDGAEILLSVAVFEDRAGQRYGSTIQPDELVPGSCETLCAAASVWLQSTMREQAYPSAT
ncbi:MAG: peptidase S41 [Caldilinea sp. CFX5]|nr:peptidase S41 [Caldilinea sp. CFX5]